jgi:hypothetical protein
VAGRPVASGHGGSPCPDRGPVAPA